MYYHARYYDPFVSRFVSPDSVVPGTAMGRGSALTVHFHEPNIIGNHDKFAGGPSNPQNLNRYSYASNNPILHTDPTGHDDPDNNAIDNSNTGNGSDSEGNTDNSYILYNKKGSQDPASDLEVMEKFLVLVYHLKMELKVHLVVIQCR